jgi:hypothetical protein
VPIVFVGGTGDKLERTRRLLPDAEYCTWRGIRGAVRRATGRSPAAPVVPGTMAGYSGTPLPKKLGIKARSDLALLGAPEGFEAALAPLPEGVSIRRRARGEAGVVMLFAPSMAVLRRRLPAAVRAHGLDAGLADFKICAIDETWSGLAFARRK